MPSSAPFVFVSTDAVQEIKNRIFLVSGIIWGRVNERFAFVADRFGIVFDHLQFPGPDSFALFVEALRRIRKRGLIIRLQFDRPAEPTAATFSARSPLVGCGGNLSAAFAFRRRLRR